MELILSFVGIISAGMIAVGVYMIKGMAALCERVARVEERVKNHHP